MKDLQLIKADTCSPEDSITKIAKFMQKNKSRRVFVIDKNKKLIGILTTVDILNKVVAKEKDPSKVKAEEIMEKKVLSIELSDSLDKALGIMNSLKTFVCPIVDKGKLLGIVSYQSIIASVVKSARS